MCTASDPAPAQIADPLPGPTPVANDLEDPLMIRSREKRNKAYLTRKRTNNSARTVRVPSDGVSLSIRG